MQKAELEKPKRWIGLETDVCKGRFTEEQMVAIVRRAGPLRYVGLRRSAPSHQRPTRGKERPKVGWPYQIMRGTDKLDRLFPVQGMPQTANLAYDCRVF